VIASAVLGGENIRTDTGKINNQACVRIQGVLSRLFESVVNGKMNISDVLKYPDYESIQDEDNKQVINSALGSIFLTFARDKFACVAFKNAGKLFDRDIVKEILMDMLPESQGLLAELQGVGLNVGETSIQDVNEKGERT